MRRILKVFMITVGIVVLVAASALVYVSSTQSKIPACDIVWEDMPENVNPNLKWMGFWGSDYDWRKKDRPDEGEPEALESLLATNAVNIIFVCGWTPDNIKMSLDRCKENNIMVFLRWHLGFAGWNNPSGVATYAEFLSDYDDIIYGFYIDEPWWNQIPEDEFKGKTKFIRDKYPEKELLVVMAVAEFSPIASYVMANVANFDPEGRFAKTVAPEGYYDYCTLLSFDFYCTLGTYDKQESLFKTLYDIFIDDLVKLKKDDQKLWFCAKGFWLSQDNPSFNTVLENFEEGLEPGDDIISILKHHYIYAQDPKYHDFEGICFYSWECGAPFVGNNDATWGIALEAFMRQDMTFTEDMFSCCGKDYAGNFYREDVLKHFQQVNSKLIENNKHKPHYYVSKDELIPRKK